jgi:hydroxymethylpyrimidine/phosphomethylpyrimidine kinase
VAEQIRAVVTDIGVDAAKTGMLASAQIIEAVAPTIRELSIPNLVVDPVSVSKHGHPLLAEDAIGALRTEILPLATLVTPNLPEAALLAGFPVQTRDDMEQAGVAILKLGARAVLVKGGHLEGSDATDLLVTSSDIEEIRGERIDTPHTHGTGCVLSAAIASFLARGEDLGEAVRHGKAFVTEAIRAHLEIGHGIGPVNPSFDLGPAT